VAVRVSPTEAIRAQIHELFESGGELLSVVEQVARLSVRLTFQSDEAAVKAAAARHRHRWRRARLTGVGARGRLGSWVTPRPHRRPAMFR
jgi:hypothetical protein